MESLRTEIRGTWAYSATQAHLKGALAVNSKLRVTPEPSNRFDRDALIVFCNRHKLGYIPRHLASRLNHYFTSGGRYEASIAEISNKVHKQTTYVAVTILLTLHDHVASCGIDSLYESTRFYDGICGVYSIQSIDNFKQYIGSSRDIGKRLRSHIDQMHRGLHANHHLSLAWNRHGPSGFKFTFIERTSPYELANREQYHIQINDAYTYGYNQTSDGKGKSPIPSSLVSHRAIIKPPPQISRPSAPQPTPARPKQSCLLLVVTTGFVSLTITGLILFLTK